MITLGIILAAIAIALIVHIDRQRACYRREWRRVLEMLGDAREQCDKLGIQNVGYRAEIIRLKTERDSIAREAAK